MSRDRHPPLPVDLHLVRGRRPHPGPVAVGPIPDSARSCIAAICRSNSPGRPQRQTALGLLGQIARPLELGTELGGQDHPALDVERMLVPPHESCHWPDLPRRSLNCVLERPFTPFRATLRPFPPQVNNTQPPGSPCPP